MMYSLILAANSYDLPEFLLKLCGAIGAVVLFLIGLNRYIKEQTWKRNEFVAKEIKEFLSDKAVQNTMYMLDWDARHIELFPNEPDYEKRFVAVNRELLNSALQPHGQKNKFTKSEVAIRDHMDIFLGYFEMYNMFIERKLISEDEIGIYLNYWIKKISSDIQQPVRQTLHVYIDKYGFQGVQQLFKRFGKDILPKTITP